MCCNLLVCAQTLPDLLRLKGDFHFLPLRHVAALHPGLFSATMGRRRQYFMLMTPHLQRLLGALDLSLRL